MIVVGCNITGDIRVYKSSGDLLKTHAIDSKCIQDIVSNGVHIAYTTDSEGTVCVIDFKTGNKLWTFDTIWSLGLCIHSKSDTILVAGHKRDRGKNVVKQYCITTGRMISRLASRLFNPFAMNTTRDKKLLVADGKTVKVYQIQ